MKKDNSGKAMWLVVWAIVLFIAGIAMGMIFDRMRQKEELKTGTWVSENQNIVVYVDYDSEMYQAIFLFEGIYIDEMGVEHALCVSFDRGRGRLTIYDASAYDGTSFQYENAHIYFKGSYGVNWRKNKISCSPNETKKMMAIDEEFTLTLIKA